MTDLLLRLYVRQAFLLHGPPRVQRDDRGEGVISAAIAVLIMAFLGVAVWVGFKATLGSTQEKVDTQIQQIGE